ncbi:hypothetical protein BVRB_034140, partial [Beta vulgaris subsp. vulgaris]
MQDAGASQALLPAPVTNVAHAELGPDLDTFDCFESNSLVRRLEIRSRTNSFFRNHALIRWFLIMVVAIFTALTALLVWVLSRAISGEKYRIVRGLIASGTVAETILVHCSLSFMLASAAAFLCAYIEPVAAGSGIPVIKCVLNGLKLPRVVRLKTLFVKALGVAFSVSAGLPVGIEGPMIHCGAICGAGVSQGKSTVFG